MGRPYFKTGGNFICPVCKKSFYRTPGQIKRGATKTCSKACLSTFFRGKGNPFWNKTHDPKIREHMSQARKGKCLGNKNGLGYRHTDEARKKIAEASRNLWSTERDKMVESRVRGENHRFHKSPELRRYRKEFTPRQRREWIGDKCAFCGSTENIELDHIIPIFDQGTPDRANVQTLCRGCNLWKIQYVDLPRYHARLALQGGRI